MGQSQTLIDHKSARIKEMTFLCWKFLRTHIFLKQVALISGLLSSTTKLAQFSPWTTKKTSRAVTQNSCSASVLRNRNSDPNSQLQAARFSYRTCLSKRASLRRKSKALARISWSPSLELSIKRVSHLPGASRKSLPLTRKTRIDALERK
jgi:hypothetical protein